MFHRGNSLTRARLFAASRFGVLAAVTVGLAITAPPRMVGATTADDICGPLEDPCIISSTVDLDADSILDFGSRTFRLAPHGKLRFTGGLALIAGTCDLQAQSGLQQKSGPSGSVLFTCDAVSLAGKMKLANGTLLRVLAAGNVAIPGKINLKSAENALIEVRAGGSLNVTGKLQAAASSRGELNELGRLQIFLQGETGATIAASALVLGKSYFGTYNEDGLTVRAPAGQVVVDGKLQYTVPHSHSSGSAIATMRARDGIRVGSTAKITARAGGNAGTGNGSSTVLSMSSQYGVISLAGRLSIHGRTPADNGGTIGITACGGSVRFEDGFTVNYASSTGFLGGLLDVGAAGTVTIGAAKFTGLRAAFWGQENVSISSSSTLQLGMPVFSGTGDYPPLGYNQDLRSPCVPVPIDSNVAFECTLVDQWDVPEPQYVAIDGTNNVYVTDWSAHRVRKYDSAGQLLTAWGSNGTGAGEFGVPTGIVVDGAGTVYVADYSNDRIQRFDGAGGYLGEFSLGMSNATHPFGLALDQDGNLDVSFGSTGFDFEVAISRYTTTGALVSAFGMPGTADDQFVQPQAIATRGSDLYVVDNRFGHPEIKVFDLNGTFLRKWGSSGPQYGQLSFVAGIALDQSGDVYVVDAERSRISKFSATGSFLGACGSPGTSDGEFSVPAGLIVLPNGNLLVADTNNDRIQIVEPF